MERPPDDDHPEEPLMHDIAELEDAPGGADRGTVDCNFAKADKAELPADYRLGDELWGLGTTLDDAARWRQSLLRLLETTA